MLEAGDWLLVVDSCGVADIVGEWGGGGNGGDEVCRVGLCWRITDDQYLANVVYIVLCHALHLGETNNPWCCSFFPFLFALILSCFAHTLLLSGVYFIRHLISVVCI